VESYEFAKIPGFYVGQGILSGTIEWTCGKVFILSKSDEQYPSPTVICHDFKNLFAHQKSKTDKNIYL
jgi:hypothetical protein